MKFDILNPDRDEGSTPPGTPPAEGDHGPTAEPPLPPHVIRLRQSSEYMRLRARTDLQRVRSSLNQMHHTVQTAQAQADPAAAPESPDEPALFRPETFRPRTHPATSDQ